MTEKTAEQYYREFFDSMDAITYQAWWRWQDKLKEENDEDS